VVAKTLLASHERQADKERNPSSSFFFFFFFFFTFLLVISHHSFRQLLTGTLDLGFIFTTVKHVMLE
jgi:hypothetical protein